VAEIFHHAFAGQNRAIHFLRNIGIAGGLLQVATSGASAFSFDNRNSVKKGRALA
jgi:putative oxidoreductase